MMIIWRGLGFLVLAVVLACALLGNLIFDAVEGHGYFEAHRWPLALSLIVAAGVCWSLGNYLQQWSVAKDKNQGDESAGTWPRHTLFFIPMHYWAPILLVIALYQTLVR
ncbi:hypothetical protein [Pedosphaera parvula]|nr:hypothetical protein [Pedosphaera parvula]